MPRVRFRFRLLVASVGLAWVVARGAETTAGNATAPAPQEAAAEIDTDALYEAGRQLFELYAPEEVKAEYDFPTKEQFDSFLPQLQAALQSDSLETLSAYAPQARAVLTTLRAAGADPDIAAWLEQRLDEAEAAQQARMAPITPPAKPPPLKPGAPKTPVPPEKAPEDTLSQRVPYYDLWLRRVQSRPTPSRAAELMPVLQRVFAAEGVPTALAWLAEAESSFNPEARSPVGAKGLFQLMPETAKGLGLSTFMPDERTHPEKSARAAAKYLKVLHGRFGDWPLALAAYNAGQGRVSRALAANKAKDFAGISATLPAETRMYVPKVCALVAVRTGSPLR